MPSVQASDVLNAADLHLIATLRDRLSDEQGRLTAYQTQRLDSSKSRQTILKCRLRVVIERLARAILDGQHFEFTQSGTPLEIAEWIERTMMLLSDAQAIPTPPLMRNDISPVMELCDEAEQLSPSSLSFMAALRES
jgi:hypothetical protein